MNSVMLNHIPLDGNMVIKKGGSGGSGGGIKYTGHADAEGLKAIGWTDEDIAYYQANGVNWNEEDDEYHKVTDDNKALYGVLTIDNIDEYKDRIVYLPKIDTSEVTDMANKFQECGALTASPMLDTSSVTDMRSMFYRCYSLTTIPLLDTSSVTDMNSMFTECHSLTTIPLLDTSKVTKMSYTFYYCYSLKSIPPLDTSKVTSMQQTFNYCFSLVGIPPLDTSKAYLSETFNACRAFVGASIDFASTGSGTFRSSYTLSLVRFDAKNLKVSITLSDSPLLSKSSVLYMIENEAATGAITITLHSYAYSRLAEDADIVNALTNHPNISLASA